MPIPTSTISESSSLVSTMDGTTSFTESMVEFVEYIVVPLSDYFYKKHPRQYLEEERREVNIKVVLKLIR